MMLVSLQQLLDKIRTLCKQCSITSLPTKVCQSQLAALLEAPDCNSTCLSEYIKALDELRVKIFAYNELEEEYRKLEEALQKSETQIRKHIGVQNQFKLYIDTVKTQFEESENERLELLDNSKAMIKQLKMENQKLHERIKDSADKKYPEYKVREPTKRQIGSHGHSRDRVKTDYSSSVNVNNHRLYTEHSFVSPFRDKTKQSDVKIDLTDRINLTKKKKIVELKRRQHPSYTVIAYSTYNKKRNSKQKNQLKKALICLSDSKKTANFNTDSRDRHESFKKANRSVFQVYSIDNIKQDELKRPKIKKQRRRVESKNQNQVSF